MSHRKVVETFGAPTPPGKERKLNRKRLENELTSIAERPNSAIDRPKTAGGKRHPATKTERRQKLVRQALKDYTEQERKRLARERYQHPARGGTLAAAADAAGVSRSTIERWIIDDPQFREEMIEAHETVIDRLETLAFRRAKGSPSQGIPGSDDLLKFLLRANRPKFASAGSSASSSYGGTAAQRAQEEEQKQQALKQKFKIAGQEIEF